MSAALMFGNDELPRHSSLLIRHAVAENIYSLIGIEQWKSIRQKEWPPWERNAIKVCAALFGSLFTSKERQIAAIKAVAEEDLKSFRSAAGY